MRWSTIAVLLLALSPRTPGQTIEGVPRARTFGVVQTADGAPWAGAEVLFLSRAWTFWLEDDDASDLVVTRADGRGRFGARLLAGRSYRCWARAEAGDGRVLFSTEVVTARANERVELTAGDEPVGPTTVRLEGLVDAGELDVHLVENGVAVREIPLERRDDGALVVPPIPTRRVSLHVLGDQRQPVLDATLEADGGEHTVGPGDGSWHRVRVFDLDAKKPIPGARIVWKRQARFIELARTGEDGTAALDLSFRSAVVDGEAQRQITWQLAVQAEGWHLGMLQIENLDAGRPSRDALEADATIDAECRPQRVAETGLVGRLLVGGKPAADWPLRVTGTAWHRDARNSSSGTGSVMVVRTGADGTFRLDGLSDGDEPFELILGETQLRALPEAWRRGLPARVSLPLPRGDGDPVDIDLVADARVVDVQVTAQDDGLPVEAARIVYGDGTHGRMADARTDRVGRARLLIYTRSEGPLFVATCCDRGWGIVEVSRSRLLRMDPDRPVPIPLALRATTVIDGELVRGDGVPADARVWIHPSVDRRMGGADATLQAQEPPGDAVFAPIPRDEVPPRLILRTVQGVRSDGDRFVLHLPDAPLEWMLSAWMQHDGAGFRGEARFSADDDRGPHGVEIELRRQ